MENVDEVIVCVDLDVVEFVVVDPVYNNHEDAFTGDLVDS